MIMKTSYGFKDMKEKLHSIREGCKRLIELKDFASKNILEGSDTSDLLRDELRLAHESLALHMSLLKKLSA